MTAPSLPVQQQPCKRTSKDFFSKNTAVMPHVYDGYLHLDSLYICIYIGVNFQALKNMLLNIASKLRVWGVQTVWSYLDLKSTQQNSLIKIVSSLIFSLRYIVWAARSSPINESYAVPAFVNQGPIMKQNLGFSEGYFIPSQFFQQNHTEAVSHPSHHPKRQPKTCGAVSLISQFLSVSGSDSFFTGVFKSKKSDKVLWQKTSKCRPPTREKLAILSSRGHESKWPS